LKWDRKPAEHPAEEPILARHALHAFAIQIEHPTGKAMRFEAPMAADMAATCEAMRRWRGRNP
jgi:hypothetical protein